MRWPRFRLRTLLVLVVLAGVSVGGYVLWRRSAEYRKRASDMEVQEIAMGELADSMSKRARATGLDADRIESGPDNDDFIVTYSHTPMVHKTTMAAVLADMREQVSHNLYSATRYVRHRRHYASLKKKYRRAARYPWLPVAPDPPEPE